MDLFQNSLKEALTKNEQETKKWTEYRDEMVQAEASLREFSKNLQVEVMVPIGSKALAPGFLYHTSEVLVSHGSKVFSKCTALQAMKVAKHRQDLADKRLEALSTERDLYSNKLEMPFMQNAFGVEGGQEIIEEYDEEQERLWRDEHRRKVAAHKRQEAEERKSLEVSQDWVSERLDELEMMEELDRELEEMGVTSDEQLQKLLSGEMKPPEGKKRVSHLSKEGEVRFKDQETYSTVQEAPKKTFPTTSNGAIPKTTQRVPKLAESEVQSASEGPDMGFWDEIVTMQDDEDTSAVPFRRESDSESEFEDETLSLEVQAEWRAMQEDMKLFNVRQKHKFLKKKLKEVDTSLRELKITDGSTLTRKLDLGDLREVVQDEILRLEDFMTNSERDESAPEDDREEPSKPRTIRFAQEDDVKLINSLDAPIVVSERPTSLEIDPTLTKEIRFKHSLVPNMQVTSEDEDSISSPLDIYRKFEHCLSNKETRTEPLLELEGQKKSILKNKERVKGETRAATVIEEPEKKVQKGRRKKVEAVKDILGEVVEKQVDYEAQTAKDADLIKVEPERVSKFKSNRSKK